MDDQTPSEPIRLESDSTHLSPGVSETPALSPLFSIGDITSSSQPIKYHTPTE
jgi:hypothetical protein